MQQCKPSHSFIRVFCIVIFLVLWMIITLVSAVDNSTFRSPGRQYTQIILPIEKLESNYRLRRTAEEDSVNFSTADVKPTVEKVQQEFHNNGSEKISFSKENRKSPDNEENTKMNPPYKQSKNSGNYFKNENSYNIYNLSKDSSTNNKDSKSKSTDVSSKRIYTKHLTTKLLSDPTKEPLHIPGSTTKEVVDEIHEMNDQPEAVVSELPLNASEFNDDETLLQNSSLHTEGDNATSADSRTMPAIEGLDIILICSIILGTILLVGLIGGSGYVVYRRRIWNKPQTLSDKCSNADSSGYIDDSTLRENSEEMYSLDNDSFLNSLEAMTIQNYWTDNVKHTKL